MLEVSAYFRLIAYEFGMYIWSWVSSHLVLNLVYAHMYVCQRLMFSLTSLDTVTAETMHIIVYINYLLMRLLSCNYY